MKSPPYIIALLLVVLLVAGCDACGGCTGPPDSPGEFKLGTQPRLEAPHVDDDERREHRQATRTFAFELLDDMRANSDDDNFVLSPYAVQTALARLYAGAGGETARQMADILHVPGDDGLHTAFNELDLRLSMHAHQTGFRLQTPAAIAVDDGIELRPEALNTLTRHYSDGVHGLDFSPPAEASRQALNRWVAAHTHHDFAQLLPPDIEISTSSIVLASAAHFSAAWLNEFDPRQSAPTPFYVDADTTVDTTMLHGDDSVRYVDDGDTLAAAIPYMGANLSFIALMPADEKADFQDWEQGLDRQQFDEITGGLSGLVDAELVLPQFAIDSTVDLQDALTRQGVSAAFDADGADFSRFVDDGSLSVDAAFHGAKIDINARGSGERFSRPRVSDEPVQAGADKEIPTLRFDRPFYFVVYDEGAELIVLLGRFIRPAEGPSTEVSGVGP